ncbi:2-oxoacid:acceptor oxidoreductase subunit alpha [Patescibacteria group bacterium]|nr:2-oxoacid:acceptor oxidoreductase subunit alpha [Patescibacteria group bacterium]
MNFKNRFVVKVVGESGQGVNSIGEVLAKALKDNGLFIFGYREYPSLIKGGDASYQIDIANKEIKSSSAQCDVLMCLVRSSFKKYLKSVRENGSIIHSVVKLTPTPEEELFIKENKINVEFIPAKDIAVELGGKRIMSNTIMLGAIWQIFGLEITGLEDNIRQIFSRKPEVIEINLKCLNTGHDYDLSKLQKPKLGLRETKNFKDDLLMSGNHAIGLGAIAAGVRVYYSYPMTPSSSILSYLSSVYHETGMIVKQIEDEISVANMAIGSMHMGARTMIATSGGGFDLMTETVSLSGITETPFVCVIAQRPGPGTGLPTWTSASDLNLAIYSGHGEYTKCVVAAHDIASCYTVTQQAFNIAEKYQIPVIILTEKQIAESIFQVDKMPQDIPIERHIVEGQELEKVISQDRYKNTETGVSLRWLPGSCDATFDANGDEHLSDGSLTEDAVMVKEIYEKRIRKEEYLLKDLPEPEVFGSKNPDLSFVGWGSVKNSMLDVIDILNERGKKKIAYLHYEYVYPLKTEVFQKFAKNAKKLVLIENNATGQLGNLITSKTGVLLKNRLLKFDGRPFFLEDIIEYIEKIDHTESEE